PIALPAASPPGRAPAHRDDADGQDPAVHDQPGEEGRPVDAVPATPPDGLPVMRRGAPRAEPDTVGVPAVEPEGEAPGAGETRPAPAVRPGIRYAPAPGRPLVAEPGPEPQTAPVPSGAKGDGYGDADDGRQYAGLVYTAGAEEADEPGSREPAAADGEDTHLFAGGLFTPASRLNRVRSMPVPPGDDE
ncbi:MAG TPA: hypothetical protein VHF26_19405, partial [Trebonia sp.]|nr:hypothetical protein [Trebonia sp.]